MNYNPVNSFVIIKKPEAKQSTSGIILTGATDDANQGEVISIDPSNFMGLQVGDSVLFDQANASIARVNGEKVFIVPEDKIFSILKD